MKKVLIIADDLTGATNSASLLIRNSKGVLVFIDSADLSKEDLGLLKKNKIVILNTNTRTEKKEYALKTILQLSNVIKEFANRIIIKKIDTAYRGNVLIELDTILKLINRRFSFIINSIPYMNRITVGGFQIINGRFLEDSDFAFDPYEKIKSSFIPDILGHFLKLKPGLIRLEEIRKGQNNIKKLINNYINNNINTIIFDSVSDEDIDSILNAAGNLLGERVFIDMVWTGSLGLISSINRNLLTSKNAPCFDGKVKKDSENDGLDTLVGNPTNLKKTFGVSASMHKISYKQIINAEESGLIKIKRINIKEILSKNKLDVGNNILSDEVYESVFFDSKELNDILKTQVNEIKSELKNNNVFLIPEVDENISKKRVEKVILQILTKIIKELFLHPDKTLNVERLILIGGETSFHILKALHTRTVSILGKIENGIDYGLVQDGIIKGKELLIKGGSVGNEQSITRMICHNFNLTAVD